MAAHATKVDDAKLPPSVLRWPGERRQNQFGRWLKPKPEEIYLLDVTQKGTQLEPLFIADSAAQTNAMTAQGNGAPLQPIPFRGTVPVGSRITWGPPSKESLQAHHQPKGC